MNRSGKSIEILAPVGGQEQLVAAVRSGADAVYFGLQDFNARRNAENFAGEGLKDSVAYCHLHGVKVYITINTLVKDEELAAVKKAVDTAGSAAVDALIVQDLAVAAYARQAWPGLPLFASTQMACVNEAGARQLAEMGFSRVVLARELSLAEIRRVISRTGAEAEVFVHGAHCMSVSGACYLSSVIGARSGNRGLCAQPCRLDWHLGGKDYALSLKDLSYVERLKELEAAGVASVKIEGRMKRAEYVAASVTACRDALDGRKP
ncbi:MAG: U32 family peptidase, partial [Firmicutes bacterium]|nr:U32 family peptidase [Bacillota bacterium]